MKKILGILLVLTLVLSMSVVAFADYEDDSSVTINKNLAVNGGTNPSETFSFAIEKGTGKRDGVTFSAPDFKDDTFTISVNQGETTGSADLYLPEFTQVGVYTYPITEIAGNTAGMRYDSGEYYLVVTVTNDPDNEGEFLRVLTLTDENNLKTEAFQNSFSAGDLTINKIITGNFADPDDVFTVTVTVTPDEGKVINSGPIVWNADEDDVVEEEGVYTATYTLKGGESVTIQNLPYDVSYTVVETRDTRYDAPKYDDNAQRAFNEAAIATTITNNRNIGIETGVNLDSLPYFIILALAIGGLAVFMVRRRMVINE